jgi:hypothetical protein
MPKNDDVIWLEGYNKVFVVTSNRYLSPGSLLKRCAGCFADHGHSVHPHNFELELNLLPQ